MKEVMKELVKYMFRHSSGEHSEDASNGEGDNTGGEENGESTSGVNGHSHADCNLEAQDGHALNEKGGGASVNEDEDGERVLSNALIRRNFLD